MRQWQSYGRNGKTRGSPSHYVFVCVYVCVYARVTGQSNKEEPVQVYKQLTVIGPQARHVIGPQARHVFSMFQQEPPTEAENIKAVLTKFQVYCQLR